MTPKLRRIRASKRMSRRLTQQYWNWDWKWTAQQFGGGQLNCNLFLWQHNSRAQAIWRTDEMIDRKTLDGLFNVNQALIRNNLCLLILLWYFLFCICSFFVVAQIFWLVSFLRLLCPAIGYSLFLSFFVHATVTLQTQKHRRAPNKICCFFFFSFLSAKFDNSLTFLVLRTNECQKEESALTASNHWSHRWTTIKPNLKLKKTRVAKTDKPKISNKKLAAISQYTHSDH